MQRPGLFCRSQKIFHKQYHCTSLLKYINWQNLLNNGSKCNYQDCSVDVRNISETASLWEITALHKERKRLSILQVWVNVFQTKFFVWRTDANEVNFIFSFIQKDTKGFFNRLIRHARQNANFQGNPLLQASSITKRNNFLLPVGFFQLTRMCAWD